MKRGTPNHPKTLWLRTGLGISRHEAVGLLEMLWHFTAAFAPQGDVGQYTDGQIAEACDWAGDPAQLVAKLRDAGFLDADKKHRYLVHNWAKHADQGVKKYLGRNGLAFLAQSRTRSGHIHKEDRPCPDTVRTAVAVAPAPAPAVAPANGSEGVSERAREPDPPPAEAVPVEALPPITVPPGAVVSEVDETGRPTVVSVPTRPTVVQPPDTPERRELRSLREQIRAELPVCAAATHIRADELLAMESKLGHKSGFVDVEQIPTVAWARNVLRRLQARRLAAQGEAADRSRPMNAAERTVAAVQAVIARDKA